MGDKKEYAADDYGGKFDEADDRWNVEQEVVRRVRKVSKADAAKAVEEYVSVDWDDVFPKKPKDRLKWLDKALRACKAGKIKALPIFNIIMHRKFIDGLQGHMATDTLNVIRGSMDVFSHKQQKQLTSDSFDLWRKYAPMGIIDSDDDEAAAPPLPPPPKVIIDKKEKEKLRLEKEKAERIAAAEQMAENSSEEEQSDKEENPEAKRRKKLGTVERRIDPADGAAYKLEEFIQEYGGSTNSPPVEWRNAAHTAMFFKT